MDTYRAKLLGKFCLEDNKGTAIDLQGRKVQELLGYLLLFPYPHPREKLAEILWEKNTNNHTNRYLRRTLCQLRKSFELLCSNKQTLLEIESDWIQLNPQAPLWLDVAEIESAYNCIEGVSGNTLTRQTAQFLRDAIDLYTGDLLEGWYQTWCISERERIQHMFMTLIDKLTQFWIIKGELDLALRYSHRALRLDPAREYTHRQLMRLHYFARDRSRAIRQYDICVSVLRDELDVEPAQRTNSLLKQIREDKLLLPLPPSKNPDQEEELDHRVAGKMKHELDNIRANLMDLQYRLDRLSKLVT
jgi:DNA-binding SARP family transcriptional activator